MADDEPTVEILPEVKEQMANDPDMAAAIREFSALARQAMHGVSTGQYASFDDAMEAITGQRPEVIEVYDDDNDFDGGILIAKVENGDEKGET